jgi:hypothetical protein
MEKIYCRVVNDEVVWGPKFLPNKFGNVVLKELSDPELGGIGFYVATIEDLGVDQETGDPVIDHPTFTVLYPAVDIDIESVRSSIITEIQGIRSGILDLLVKSPGVSAVYDTNVSACHLYIGGDGDFMFGTRLDGSTYSAVEYLTEMSQEGPYADVSEFAAFIMQEYSIGQEVGRQAENAYVKYKTLAATATVIASLTELPGKYNEEMVPYTSAL